MSRALKMYIVYRVREEMCEKRKLTKTGKEIEKKKKKNTTLCGGIFFWRKKEGLKFFVAW